MRRTLQLHVLRPATHLSPPPERGEAFEVEAPGLDELRERVKGELARRGYRVRAVSFTPTGLVAYVEAAS
jgi:hypothetical protein